MNLKFTARGHPAILSTHLTTLEITKDKSLTKRGDCIVAVSSSTGLIDLPGELKETLRQSRSRGRLTLKTGVFIFRVEGSGHPRLTFSNSTDIVVRKSDFISDRTLFVNADKSASDIPREMVKALRDPKRAITIEISAISP